MCVVAASIVVCKVECSLVVCRGGVAPVRGPGDSGHVGSRQARAKTLQAKSASAAACPRRKRSPDPLAPARGAASRSHLLAEHLDGHAARYVGQNVCADADAAGMSQLHERGVAAGPGGWCPALDVTQAGRVWGDEP